MLIRKQTNTSKGSTIRRNERASNDASVVSAYANKRATIKFRGMSLGFDLSQRLFSSAGIDRGSRLLLRLFSNTIDALQKEGRPLPSSVLDAGSGTGVLGIAAARALLALPAASPSVQTQGGGLRVICQDRDELARLFTASNAALNGLSGETLSARTEPLLAGEPGWDLILSNLPAKTGDAVLRDFTGRAAGLLNPGGRVLAVIVKPLAQLLRSQILEEGLSLYHDEEDSGHCLFMYGNGAGKAGSAPLSLDADLAIQCPAYARHSAGFVINGIACQIDSLHGAAGFDSPGGAVFAAAALWQKIWPKLWQKISLAAVGGGGGGAGACTGDSEALTVIVHEPGQGHFPAWLNAFLAEQGIARDISWVLSGRNIIGLLSARHNIGRTNQSGGITLVPAVEYPELPAANFACRCLIAFPDPAIPDGRMAACWEAWRRTLEDGGVLLIAAASRDAERLDRSRTGAFARLGDIRRDGFRALAYW